MKKYLDTVLSLFSDEENVDEPGYEPAHIAGVIVVTLFAMAVLFWLLWALLVFGGGIQAKISPLAQVMFTAKTVKDFGYIGYPYAMGVFEGWVTNLAALIISILLLTGIWYIFAGKISNIESRISKK